jgi:hypothetical protein
MLNSKIIIDFLALGFVNYLVYKNWSNLSWILYTFLDVMYIIYRGK